MATKKKAVGGSVKHDAGAGAVQNRDRSGYVTVGGEKYQLLLTTQATMEISEKYEGLENLEEKLFRADRFDLVLAEICWFITLLANQAILIHNLQHPDKKPLLTEEAMRLLTNPFEISEYQEAIILSLNNGMKRNINSEDDNDSEKNPKGE